MERFSGVSSFLFGFADILAIAALVLPDWVVTSVGGGTRIGLLRSCMVLNGNPEVCYFQPMTDIPEWFLALGCLILAIVFITGSAILLFISSLRNREAAEIESWGKWTGFTGVSLLCVTALVVPLGFWAPSVALGGAAFRFPHSSQVGLSYICFVMATWIAVIAVLFASRVCLPHL